MCPVPGMGVCGYGTQKAGKLFGEPLLRHKYVVWSVAANADGQTVVSADVMGQVVVWSAAPGTKRYKPIICHDFDYGALSVSVSPNGLMFVAALDDSTIRLFERRKSQWFFFDEVAFPRHVDHVYFMYLIIEKGHRLGVACDMGELQWATFDVIQLNNC